MGDRAFTYDAIGNVLSDGKRTYTWEHGRQLAALTQNGATWTNTYDVNGLRMKRTDGTNTYQYYYIDGNLVSMTYNGSRLYFAYSPDGLPYGVEYGGTQYVYALNLQGDVVAILDASGAKVVEYTYDAWGNILSVTGSMADTLGQINPLRYRGYVYDNETGLYFLQSRYYDPELGRFINADAFASTGQGILGNNMYAYCGNNPICRMDPTGKSFIAVLGLVAIIGLIMCIPSSENQAPYEKAAAKEKYNKNTINFSVGEVGTDPDKLNVTFYPDNRLIHIENSWSISSRYEKEAVISTIMESEFYNATTYGNSKKTMLIEWSAHNFLYRFANSSPVMYDFCVSIGYPNPISRSQSVDFRKELVPSVRRNYNIVTLWGVIQW